MLYRNHLETIGNIGRVEVLTINGRKIARLSVAVNSRAKDRRTGEVRDYTDWVAWTFFGERTVGFIERYAEKGAHVAIGGKVRQTSYDKADGTTVHTTECIGLRFEFVQPKAGPAEAQAPTGDDGDGDDIPY